MATVWSGLDELRQQLRRLPEELALEGARIVEDAADTVATQLRQSYPPQRPEGRGLSLRAGVDVQRWSSRYGARLTVVSRARHAHLWEFGTRVRRTQRGFYRGRAPHNRAVGLVALAQRARRTVLTELTALVERAGFTVRSS